MKFGFRIPSLTKSISARASLKRIVRQSFNLRTPKGLGIVTNPEKVVYN